MIFIIVFILFKLSSYHFLVLTNFSEIYLIYRVFQHYPFNIFLLHFYEFFFHFSNSFCDIFFILMRFSENFSILTIFLFMFFILMVFPIVFKILTGFSAVCPILAGFLTFFYSNWFFGRFVKFIDGTLKFKSLSHFLSSNGSSYYFIKLNIFPYNVFLILSILPNNFSVLIDLPLSYQFQRFSRHFISF